jgi:hypothetical protein
MAARTAMKRMPKIHLMMMFLFSKKYFSSSQGRLCLRLVVEQGVISTAANRKGSFGIFKNFVRHPEGGDDHDSPYNPDHPAKK